MRVVALFRVSTERQAELGASLDAQERRYHELARQCGWTTVAEFKGAESATVASKDRRVLQQLLACLREREVDAVYVHEQSRLTRGDELEVALLLRELAERSVKIIVNGHVRDLSSIDESFMVGIQALVDRAESKRIKERLKRGKNEKARQGRRVSGAAPFGYANPGRETGSHGTLKIVPEEAAVVRRIFELRAQGKGVPSIAAELNRAGVRSPRDARWGKTTIRNILANPAYAGISATNVWVQHGKPRTFKLNLSNPDAIIVPDAHEAIIERALWDAVNGRPKCAPTKRPRLLTGLLHINGVKGHGDTFNNKAQYRGPRGLRGLPWLTTPETDDAVWDAFCSLAVGEDFVRQLLERSRANLNQDLIKAEIEFQEERIAKAKKRLDRLVEMRADGEIDKETFLAKRAAEDGAIEGARRELEEQRGKLLSADAGHAARIAGAVRCLVAGKERLTCEQKRQILLSLVRRIDVTAERGALAFKRDERGKILPGSAGVWGITAIRFVVALKPEAGEGTRLGPTSPATAGTARGGGRANAAGTPDSRAGQAATTLSNSVPLSKTEDLARSGHSGTTLSRSDRAPGTGSKRRKPETARPRFRLGLEVAAT